MAALQAYFLLIRTSTNWTHPVLFGRLWWNRTTVNWVKASCNNHYTNNLQFGALGGTRTRKTQTLILVSIPVPSLGQNWSVYRDSNPNRNVGNVPCYPLNTINANLLPKDTCFRRGVLKAVWFQVLKNLALLSTPFRGFPISFINLTCGASIFGSAHELEIGQSGRNRTGSASFQGIQATITPQTG